MRLALTALILTILWSGTAFAQPMPGDALVIDPSVGTNGDGALFSVDQGTGFRTIISDFGDGTQGPTGVLITGLTLDVSSGEDALVIDQAAGTGFQGALFRVDLTTGFRTIISDFGDGTQGPTGVAPFGVTLDGSGDALVIDPAAGTGGLGELFSVDLTTGFRVSISDFGDGTQGPLGVAPVGVALDGSSGDALVIDQSAGMGGDGELFRVNLTTGDRTSISDFGDGGMGPTGMDPRHVILDEDPLNALVTDPTSVDLFRVVLFTGIRTVVSDFTSGAQGPTGVNPEGVTLGGSALVVDPGAGTNGDGELFSVDLTTGDRVSISDFGNVAQGPLGSSPFNVVVFNSIVDLAVVKSGFPDPVIVEGSLAYTIIIVNFQGFTVGVTLTDTLPADVTFVSATPDQGSCLEAAGTVTCDIGVMGEGDIVQVDIIVTAPLTAGAIVNVAEVTSEFPDINLDNNSTEIITQVIPAPPNTTESDLLVVKIDAPDPVVIGEVLTYSVFVYNFGPDLAQDVILTDILPETGIDLSMVTAPSGCIQGPPNDTVLTCDLGDIAVGGVAIVTITVKPNDLGIILNVVQAALGTSQIPDTVQVDPVPSNNTDGAVTTVVQVPPPIIPDPPDEVGPTGVDFFVLKFVSPNPAVVGDEITYTIIVGNNSEFSDGTTLVDTLPSGVSFISATTSTGEECTLAGDQLTCVLGSVPPIGSGEVVTVEIIVRADQTGTIPNIAFVGGINDPNGTNNVAIVASDVVSGSGDPDPNPTDTGGDSDGSNNSNCSSSLVGAPKLSDTAFNLGLLLLPLLIFSIRAIRRRKVRA